jgi:hypothetical protein
MLHFPRVCKRPRRGHLQRGENGFYAPYPKTPPVTELRLVERTSWLINRTANSKHRTSISRKSLRRATSRKVVRDHSSPTVSCIDRSWSQTPEESSRYRRATGEEQVIDIVTVKIRGANRLLAARSGARSSGRVLWWYGSRWPREYSKISLDGFDCQLFTHE